MNEMEIRRDIWALSDTMRKDTRELQDEVRLLRKDLNDIAKTNEQLLKKNNELLCMLGRLLQDQFSKKD